MTGADVLDTQLQLGYHYDDDPRREQRLEMKARTPAPSPGEPLVLARATEIDLSARETAVVFEPVPPPRRPPQKAKAEKGAQPPAPRTRIVLRDVVAADRTPRLRPVPGAGRVERVRAHHDVAAGRRARVVRRHRSRRRQPPAAKPSPSTRPKRWRSSPRCAASTCATCGCRSCGGRDRCLGRANHAAAIPRRPRSARSSWSGRSTTAPMRATCATLLKAARA